MHQIPHNAPLRNRNVHVCAHFCYNVVHCGMWGWCIVGGWPQEKQTRAYYLEYISDLVFDFEFELYVSLVRVRVSWYYSITLLSIKAVIFSLAMQLVIFRVTTLITRMQRVMYDYSTCWDRNQMAAILKTTISNAFHWIKCIVFRYKIEWNMLPRTICQHWFIWWFVNHCMNQ